MGRHSQFAVPMDAVFPAHTATGEWKVKVPLPASGGSIDVVLVADCTCGLDKAWSIVVPVTTDMIKHRKPLSR